MTREQLIRLASTMAGHINRSEQTLSNRIVGHARLFRRLRERKGCNISTAETVARWFSENWPTDLEWPRDIPRPAKPKSREAA